MGMDTATIRQHTRHPRIELPDVPMFQVPNSHQHPSGESEKRPTGRSIGSTPASNAEPLDSRHDGQNEQDIGNVERGGSSQYQPSRKRKQQHPHPTVSPTSTATHQCQICHRTYERADRLKRHLMTHENARRHRCQVELCQKSFNRADLLTRHLLRHSRNDNDDTDGSGLSIGNYPTDRAGRACLACASAKTRCEDNKPCRRCLTKGITCEVPIKTSNKAWYQKSATAASKSHSLDTNTVNLVSNPTVSQPLRSGQQQHQHQQEEERDEDENVDESEDEGDDKDGQDQEQQLHVQQLHLQQLHVQDHVNNAFGIENQPPGLTLAPTQHYNPHVNQLPSHHEAMDHQIAPVWVDPMAAQVEIHDMHSMSTDENSMVFDDIISNLLFMPPNAVDFNNQNLDITLLDFTFHDAQLDAFPSPYLEHPKRTSTGGEMSGQTPRPTRDVRAGYAAFTRSPWLWTPQPRDYILGDKENLSLDDDSISSALTPSSSGLAPNVPSCGFPTIKPAMRDKMYHLVATMDKYTNRISDFPSLTVLNHVVDAFFVRQTYQVDNWIHIPSLSLSEFIPELGMSMVIAGSSVIAVPAIWKMGLVLQDVVRVKLGELWDRQNSAIRQLQPLQAWMLTLDAGLWSGFQRQMELSESFVQTLITMMRRGGMFRATADTQTLIPLESDTVQVLEAKWKQWVQRESFKRLAIHLFLHDTRASIALQKNPLMSVTEMTISLPVSRCYFLAGSATEWKSCFRERKVPPLSRSSLQLTDIMHDLSVLDGLHSELDVLLCYAAAIHGFWCQIWAFRESWKFYDIGANKDSIQRLWLMTQQRELNQQIETFEENLFMQVRQSELFVMIELLLMILHVSPEELQHFAGKYGEEAASQAFVGLDQWSLTEQARKAVWHAGQVFRWASLMPPAELRDFYAIAVYFASLVLWAFGHLSGSRDAINDSRNRNNHAFLESTSNNTFVVLNGEKTSAARSFITGRQIIPTLTAVTSTLYSQVPGTQDGALIRLDDPNSVLQMARDLYRTNYPFEGEPLPPLVENMRNLMRDLGSMPENRFSRCVSPIERTMSRGENNGTVN